MTASNTTVQESTAAFTALEDLTGHPGCPSGSSQLEVTSRPPSAHIRLPAGTPTSAAPIPYDAVTGLAEQVTQEDRRHWCSVLSPKKPHLLFRNKVAPLSGEENRDHLLMEGQWKI
jgi:hypothetical protein